MRKKWKIREVTYIRENVHQTDKELAAYFGCTKASIDWIRRSNNIMKYKKQTK